MDILIDELEIDWLRSKIQQLDPIKALPLSPFGYSQISPFLLILSIYPI